MRDIELIVSGRVKVRRDKHETAVQAAIKLADASRNEPGCKEFRVYTDAAEANTIFVFEVWENVDAMTKHFQTAHMAEYQERLKGITVGEPEVKRYVIAA